MVKLKMTVKMRFFTIFAMFIVRSFYIIFADISCHLIVPLNRGMF